MFIENCIDKEPRNRDHSYTWKCTVNGSSFLTYETEFVQFLAVLENSVLPMG